MINFMERQRALFDEQRRHQAEALEFLHRYRADDEMVLGQTSNKAKMDRDRRRTTMSGPLTPPDARASSSIHSYHHAESNLYHHYHHHHDSGSKTNMFQGKLEMPHFDSRNNHIMPTIMSEATLDAAFISEEDPMRFEDARRKLMELLMREASHLPLPSDDDNSEDTRDGKTGENDKLDDSRGILIADGSGSEDMGGGTIELSSSFIPFESFLKLGESQIMQQQPKESRFIEQYSFQFDGEDVNSENVNAFRSIDSATTASTTIPVESFLQLGASMMAKSSPQDLEDDDSGDNTDIAFSDELCTQKVPEMVSKSECAVMVIPGEDATDDTAPLTDVRSHMDDPKASHSLASTLTESLKGEDRCGMAGEGWKLSSSTLQERTEHRTCEDEVAALPYLKSSMPTEDIPSGQGNEILKEGAATCHDLAIEQNPKDTWANENGSVPKNIEPAALSRTQAMSERAATDLSLTHAPEAAVLKNNGHGKDKSSVLTDVGDGEHKSRMSRPMIINPETTIIDCLTCTAIATTTVQESSEPSSSGGASSERPSWRNNWPHRTRSATRKGGGGGGGYHRPTSLFVSRQFFSR